MYILIRAIIIICEGLIIFLSLFLSGVIRVGNGSKTNESNIAGWAIFTALMTCFGAVAFVPFEDSFVTFPTVEDSLHYSSIPTDNLLVREYGDCAFTASHDGVIHTVNIRNGGYGVIDAHSLTHSYTRMSNNADENICCTAVTNTQAEKTFYLIFVTQRNSENTEIRITVNGEQPDYICKLPMSTVQPAIFHPVSHYIMEKDGYAEKKLIINLNGKKVRFQ